MIFLIYKEGNYSFIAGLTNYTDEEIVTDLKSHEIKYQPFYNEMIVLYENEPIIKERDNWLERS